jgi:hypothetical protein
VLPGPSPQYCPIYEHSRVWPIGEGGLQSYPSRLKDPDTVDFSTGPVGIGATAALWQLAGRRPCPDQTPQVVVDHEVPTIAVLAPMAQRTVLEDEVGHTCPWIGYT